MYKYFDFYIPHWYTTSVLIKKPVLQFMTEIIEYFSSQLDKKLIVKSLSWKVSDNFETTLFRFNMNLWNSSHVNKWAPASGLRRLYTKTIKKYRFDGNPKLQRHFPKENGRRLLEFIAIMIAQIRYNLSVYLIVS